MKCNQILQWGLVALIALCLITSSFMSPLSCLDQLNSLQKETGPPVDTTSKMNDLWLGGATTGKYTGPIRIVLSYCKGDLAWLGTFILGFGVQRITVVSKCGVSPPTNLPIKDKEFIELPNAGRNDHTIAYSMAKISAEESEDDGIVLFLKDNIIVHQKANPRSLYELLRITAKNDFGCFQELRKGMSYYHQTDVLKTMNMTKYGGVPHSTSDGRRVWNDSKGFKSPFKNLGHWLESLDISLPSPLTPVCYGGIFAVREAKIRSLPKAKWEAIATSLSRGDNIEEGHFAERTWAGLLSAPVSEEEERSIMRRSSYVNRVAAKDGGGRLGALVK
mmetsp:Transcript_35468/g.85967  ORF Transcript_35468/g.85967 Transcript_35468/m.85967 type:complete len:333 (-) Transcript_35468:1739-2737(-)